MGKHRFSFMVALLLLSASGGAFGQATTIEDGQRRYAVGAGTSYFSGNNTTSSASLSFDTVRATQREKLSFTGKGQIARNLGATTGEAALLATRYQREITRYVYGFGQAEALRDTGARLGSRYSIANGGGFHLLRSEEHKWDVFAGLGYAIDRYTQTIELAGIPRERYERVELLVGQESSHQFSENTTLKQRLTLFPNVTDGGQHRAEFDVGLSVGMNQTISLTTSLAIRYNTQPGRGLKNRDVALITALTWKTN